MNTQEHQTRAIALHHDDDVAVMAADGEAGDCCRLEAPDGVSALPLTTAVPFGHKIALRAIKCGEPIRKYGESIGIATQNIAPGAHVHVHNLQSGRAGLRGAAK